MPSWIRTHFRISPDSKTVSYIERSNTSGLGANIFRVVIDGGTPVEINPELNGGRAIPLSVSDSNEILFTVTTNSDENLNGLYYVPASGYSEVKINSSLGPFEYIFIALYFLQSK